jgi:hypothetical protein
MQADAGQFPLSTAVVEYFTERVVELQQGNKLRALEQPGGNEVLLVLFTGLLVTLVSVGLYMLNLLLMVESIDKSNIIDNLLNYWVFG